MAVNSFARGRRAKAICDICGFTVKLSSLRPMTVNEQKTEILACRACWNPDHPQYKVGKLPVVDAQALRNPRPDQPDRDIVVDPNAEVFGVR
jgi:hypothetical protein